MGEANLGKLTTVSRLVLRKTEKGVRRISRFILNILWGVGKGLSSPNFWKVLAYMQPHLKESVRNKYPLRVSWAEEGEDLAMENVLPEIGFYVDVGAHHPFRRSVTWKLSERGWRGINIDIQPEIVSCFPSARPHDTNFLGLVGEAGPKLVRRFAGSELDTFLPERGKHLIELGFRQVGAETIEAKPLSDYLRLAGAPRTIDLLSIDVEGAELEVLLTTPFSEYDVKFVLVEDFCEAWELERGPAYAHLKQEGFVPAIVFPKSTLYRKSL